MELLGKSKDELREMFVAMGEPGYRGGQVYHALYAERKFELGQITTWAVAGSRDRLAAETTITMPVVKQRFQSRDGSVRYLFELAGTEKEGINSDGTQGPREETKLSVQSIGRVQCLCPASGRQSSSAFPRRRGVRWIAGFA